MKGKTSSFLSLAIMLGVGVFFLLHPGDTLIAATRIIGIVLIYKAVTGMFIRIKL